VARQDPVGLGTCAIGGSAAHPTDVARIATAMRRAKRLRVVKSRAAARQRRRRRDFAGCDSARGERIETRAWSGTSL
jgi:hypothetical protein